jgi:hypothetical protein
MEETARAAMRAIARTVTGAPPLHLPNPRDVRGEHPAEDPGRRWAAQRRWGGPLVAAAAVIVIALGLVIAHQAQNDPATPHTPSAASAMSQPAARGGVCADTRGVAAPTLPGDVPQYFVALCGGPKAPPVSGGRLVAANIRTGAILGSVTAPSGKYIVDGILAAADDQTFIVNTSYGTPKGPQTVFWVLRLAPGTAHPVTLTRLPWSTAIQPQVAAVSPDGTEIAIEPSQQLPGRTLRMAVRLYSMATGAILRTWVLSGFVDQIQWSGDGRDLIYATGDSDTEIMVHHSATPGSDLAAGSTQLLTIPAPGTTVPGDPAQCVSLGSLWGVSSDGTTLTCAALNRTATAFPPRPGSLVQPCTSGQLARLGFLRYTAVSHLAGTDYSVTTPCSPRTDTAALWWASPDGTEVIGQLTYPGHNDVGLFYHNRYIPLPALDSTAKSVPWDITF